MTTIKDIRSRFVECGYLWKIGEEKVVPSEQDIEATIKAIKARLADEPVGSQIEVGRLIGKRRFDGSLEIYVYYGDYDDKDS